MTKEELEKEAEEYVCKRNPLVTKEWFIDAFKKYDKGEKVKYLKDCEIAEYEAYIAGAEFGYNKANEWHFVKEELPELYKDVLVVFPRGDCDVKRLTNHNEWVGRGSWCSLTDVIAWKEIVLPELKESK